MPPQILVSLLRTPTISLFLMIMQLDGFGGVRSRGRGKERERERERERDRENVSISISKAFPLLSVLECLVSLLMFLPFLLTNRNLPLIIYDLSNSFSWKELLR